MGNLFSFVSYYSNPLSTIFVGLVALIVYYKQKIDNKKDAANILLLEIESAEKSLKPTRENLEKNGTLISEIFLMPNESWSKYKYLFVKDFTAEEWDTIADFYNYCKLYDDSVRLFNSFFEKNEEQIRVNLQKNAAEFSKEYTTKIISAKTINEKNKLSTQLLDLAVEYQKQYFDINTKRADVFYYTPQKPITDATVYMKYLNTDLTLSTTIGTKLKRMSRSAFIYMLFRRLRIYE